MLTHMALVRRIATAVSRRPRKACTGQGHLGALQQPGLELMCTHAWYSFRSCVLCYPSVSMCAIGPDNKDGCGSWTYMMCGNGQVSKTA